jgi:hypothetical protein
MNKHEKEEANREIFGLKFHADSETEKREKRVNWFMQTQEQHTVDGKPAADQSKNFGFGISGQQLREQSFSKSLFSLLQIFHQYVCHCRHWSVSLLIVFSFFHFCCCLSYPDHMFLPPVFLPSRCYWLNWVCYCSGPPFSFPFFWKKKMRVLLVFLFVISLN